MGSPPSLQQQSTVASGNGSGSQDAEPAYPIFSPSPHIADRGLLPSEVRNVVVDVDVSDTGLVTNERLVLGLGNDLDRAVLEAVKTWRFHPATVDGASVASVAELVFPLSQRYTGTES
jgi:TonB family protein